MRLFVCIYTLYNGENNDIFNFGMQALLPLNASGHERILKRKHLNLQRTGICFQFFHWSKTKISFVLYFLFQANHRISYYIQLIFFIA